LLLEKEATCEPPLDVVLGQQFLKKQQRLLTGNTYKAIIVADEVSGKSEIKIQLFLVPDSVFHHLCEHGFSWTDLGTCFRTFWLGFGSSPPQHHHFHPISLPEAYEPPLHWQHHVLLSLFQQPEPWPSLN